MKNRQRLAKGLPKYLYQNPGEIRTNCAARLFMTKNLVVPGYRYLSALWALESRDQAWKGSGGHMSHVTRHTSSRYGKDLKIHLVILGRKENASSRPLSSALCRATHPIE